METEEETHIRALDWAPNVQLKSRKNKNMSQKVKTMKDSFIETVYFSWTGKEQA